MSDDEFLAAFEDQSLPFDQWNHRAHVRVAFLYATRNPFPGAIERVRSSIQDYNRAHHVPEAVDRGYHETITQAFMRLVGTAIRLSDPQPTSNEFCDGHPELLDKRALLSFYSRERIMTLDAKREFVAPDLAPLPILFDDDLTIVHATGSDQLRMARELFSEFAESLDFDLGFQNFAVELSGLPGAYAAPRGRLLIAFRGMAPVGCVALRPLDTGVCEMKRLWVRPGNQGTGIGRRLAQSIIDEARRIGYRAMRLDTVPSMQAAISLYRSLGFVEIEPYTDNPVPGALFMELRFDEHLPP